MTSETPREAYVWIWLPGKTSPVVAGLLTAVGRTLVFNYGRSYLRRADAVPLYLPELPLQPGRLPLPEGLDMPGCIRDAAPDAWGRRVILNRLLGGAEDQADLDELTFLLESGSDRTGALDFQRSASEYTPRESGTAPLEQLLQAADMVEQGVPLSPELALALEHGTSLGGARPKARIAAEQRQFIAKFSSSTDLYNLVKAEFIAMRLAAEVGIQAAPVRLERALGRDVLLVERFDRERTEQGWQRQAMVSALTILGLDEMLARYAGYDDLAESIRHRFTHPAAALEELFRRLVFNVLCGNTDDHARNHAAFWDGGRLTLTPAYDICPQARTGNEAAQAMRIVGDRRESRLALCLEAAPNFQLSAERARAIIVEQVRTVRVSWTAVCDEAALPEAERLLLWGRQFLNPFIFEGAPAEMAEAARGV